MQQVVVMGHGEDAVKKLYLAAMVLPCVRRTLSPWTGWNSRGWAGGQWRAALLLRPILALIFFNTFMMAKDHRGSHWEGPLRVRMTVSLSVRC